MSELKARLLSDMKTAMKAGEKERLGVIRLINAAIKQREVDERIELADDDVVMVLDRMVKQRRESIRQYESGGRPDLAAIEAAEIQFIEVYLPQRLTDDEVEEMILAAISETGAAGASGMGKVMAVIKPKMQGRADMSTVSARLKGLLGA